MICARWTALLTPLLGILLAAGAEAKAETFAVDGRDFPARTFTEWKLPHGLREVSGFAADEQGRLFAVADEWAVVFQVDYQHGGLVKSFSLGNPPVAGDFEGITFIDQTVVLTTSDGVLYLAPEGGDGEHVDFKVIDTHLGRRCEIEGIAYAVDERILYFACKTPREPMLDGRLNLLAWSPATRAELPDREFGIELERFEDLPGKGKLRATDLAVSPDTGHLIVASSRRRALITLTRRGELVSAVHVPASSNLQQIEALALMPDGALALGSEGGKKKGRMRVYRVAD